VPLLLQLLLVVHRIAHAHILPHTWQRASVA